MRLLLDTHCLAWAFIDAERLSQSARSVVGDAKNEVYVSVVTPWEIAIKVGIGKWPEAITLLSNFEQQIARAGYQLLPIALQHVRTAGLMASSHRDPFDRLLAAQAQIEGLTLVTADAKLASLGAPVIW